MDLLDKKQVKKFAKQHNWTWKEHRGDGNVLVFERYDKEGHRQQVNVYFTTGTVSTALWHPKKGKTQLHRKGVDEELLVEIFKNPRVHTGEGYYFK